MVDANAIESWGQQLAANVGKFVLPIMRDHKGSRPLSVGSGFFVAAFGENFLVSAAHVFDDLVAGPHLYIYSDGDKKRVLDGARFTTPVPKGGKRAVDPIDIGVMLLRGVALPPYPTVQKFLVPVELLSPNEQDREGIQHFFVGFPSTQTRANQVSKELNVKAHAYLTASIPAADYDNVRIAPRSKVRISIETHIAMSMHERETVSLAGEKQKFPKPHGISGAPLWRLASDADGGHRLVGVVTGI